VWVERGSAGCLFAAALARPNLPAMSAPPLSRDRARRLRREQTDAERRLWMRLRRHQLGVQFRRQHPIGPYIVDFFCVERMMVVALDGGQHDDQRARDEARTQWLAAQGFRVLRFSDREALMQTEAVLSEIQNRLSTPTPILPQN
jgi:very-short-patch-repair endonuclease